MKDKLLKVCEGIAADYVEVRVHEGSSTNIDYAGKELEDISQRTGLGGCVRVLKNGGWGFAAFDDLDQMEKFARLALQQAELVGGEKIEMASVPPQVSRYRSQPDLDPADVPLADKQQLCDRYNRILLADARIRTTMVRYRDAHSTRRLATSGGTYLEQEYTFCGILVGAIAVDGPNVQLAFEGDGDLRGYQNALGREESCERAKRRALDLLVAQPVEAGTYTVIVDPKLCGVFVHEAFGHLSEADHVYENPRLLEIMQPGRRFGRDFLSVTDDGTLVGEAGFQAYDDEGVPTQRTPLINGGVLVGRLHSRETAARMGEQPTGNARAIAHNFPPIVRMTNTFMEPGELAFEQMLEDTEDGLYAVGMLGGQTDMEMFTFSAEEAYRIRKGKLAEKVREVVLTGNVFKTLADIDAVGRDLKMHGGLGGCGKAGQGPLRVADGGPHCRMRNVVIGGR